MNTTKNFFCSILFLILSNFLFSQQYSELWGKNGEKWNKDRLPDFSYAGYHQGEAAIPTMEVVANVKDFGAKGNGIVDDTEAFKKAIASAKNGAVYVPNGSYRILDQLVIDKSNVVLRGESRDSTILNFPIFLNDIIPNWGATTTGKFTSRFSWAGGFIKLGGSYNSKEITKIIKPLKRGNVSIDLESTNGLTVGQWINIHVIDTEKHTLITHLYAGNPGPTDKYGRLPETSQTVKIKAIKGTQIIIDRPLRFDINLEWSPKILSFEPDTQESGVENLTFLFPNIPYEGHFSELGHNALDITEAFNCWVKNIKIINADSGIFLLGEFCTVDGVVIESERRHNSQKYVPEATGHHGIYIHGNDNIFSNFVFKTKFIHDISVAHAAGNVIQDGSGIDLSFDHHRRNPYANLFTNINVGDGLSMYKSSGGRNLGRHSGAWETFWNIKSIRPQGPTDDEWGPNMMNFVGFYSTDKKETSKTEKWFEPIHSDEIYPQNIYKAQLKLRLQKK